LDIWNLPILVLGTGKEKIRAKSKIDCIILSEKRYKKYHYGDDKVAFALRLLFQVQHGDGYQAIAVLLPVWNLFACA